ncbi:peptidase [Sinorhizobium meliloti]|uniref:DNA/RNA non-specific endonuclease n=1 Tax=Rhizobium meliloti TaxID=382 RepID=UPI0012978992|nr:DNA/RNA non-specific endonuclease [Sinorhizobium meliloti]MDW9378062.1 peptidase [Sinorhizobium meliloti]MDW9496427.1 peptidase [Sinorhizobium meliloti]MDW9564962.1 peptidase [Sinorhizobium meliloti]MDW9652411.1 peptidase [Sinorhizobium meliloti]MDW9862820.1 peptidase [Sinorhizobium meliloti]
MEKDPEASDGEKDVVATQSTALSIEVEKVALAESNYVPAEERLLRRTRAEADTRFSARKNFLESPRSDPNGFERIIGQSDLMSINFLDRGRRAAAAVCRIKVPSDGGAWYGTGFLVGPRLLLTNHHVLGNADEASQCEAEFGYEHDIDGVLREGVRFNLRPHEIFYTNAELDITFVAVTPLSDEGVPIDRYGRLPLIPLSGKAIDGEWVTIIQHPNSEPKQIAIRASQIIVLDPEAAPDVNLDHFIHYSTDTEPGSSGAPVFNDQWQVLALHHKAVPEPKKPGRSEGKTVWIANEGVRISAIFRLLEQQRFELPQAGLVLDRLDNSLGLPSLSQGGIQGETLLEADRKPLALKRWANVAGYDPTFLSARIDLPDIYAPWLAQNQLAPLLDGSGHELSYHHFTSVIRADRKFPLLTAVNIDGNKLVHPGPRKDTWRRDARIAAEYQPDGEFYEKNKGKDPVQFSRGHQVRLLDPCWSSAADKDQALVESQIGAEDTFHYTNAAPQVQTYNDIDWGNLEDYLLDKAQSTDKRLTIFTGPIFRENDPLYGKDRKGGPWKIPLSFWKIAVLQKSPTKVAAAAFIVGQTQYVQALYEAKVFSGLKPYTVDQMRKRRIQTTIAAIEAETGLDFSAVRPFDGQGALESTRQTRWISDINDVII